MEKLDMTASCRVCGMGTGAEPTPGTAPMIGMQYCRGGVSNPQMPGQTHCTLDIEGEHLHRRCPRCSFEWPEAVIQA